MQKFEFSIKTRDGQLIERLKIAGRDQQDAERKLRQMYHHCEIVRCNTTDPRAAERQAAAASMEDLLTLIAR